MVAGDLGGRTGAGAAVRLAGRPPRLATIVAAGARGESGEARVTAGPLAAAPAAAAATVPREPGAVAESELAGSAGGSPGREGLGLTTRVGLPGAFRVGAIPITLLNTLPCWRKGNGDEGGEAIDAGVVTTAALAVGEAELACSGIG